MFLFENICPNVTSKHFFLVLPKITKSPQQTKETNQKLDKVDAEAGFLGDVFERQLSIFRVATERHLHDAQQPDLLEQDGQVRSQRLFA